MIRRTTAVCFEYVFSMGMKIYNTCRTLLDKKKTFEVLKRAHQICNGTRLSSVEKCTVLWFYISYIYSNNSGPTSANVWPRIWYAHAPKWWLDIFNGISQPTFFCHCYTPQQLELNIQLSMWIRSHYCPLLRQNRKISWSSIIRCTLHCRQCPLFCSFVY